MLNVDAFDRRIKWSVLSTHRAPNAILDVEDVQMQGLVRLHPQMFQLSKRVDHHQARKQVDG